MNSLFGVELPTAVNFFIAFIVVLVVTTLVVTIFRTSIRRFIVRISEVLAPILIVISTIGGGISGMTYARMLSGFQQLDSWQLALAFALGALATFVVSSIILAILFILIDIAENTRRTVSFFERMSSGGQA